MMIVVGIIVFVVFGLLPVGTWASAWVSHSYSVPEATAFLSLFAGSVVLLVILLRMVFVLIPRNGPPHEDRLTELGAKRFEGYTTGLVVACLVVGGLAAVVVLPHELPRIIASLGSLCIAVVPRATLVPTTWPPRLKPYLQPDEAGTSFTSSDDVVAGDWVRRDYVWSYQDSLSADGPGNRISHEIALQIRHSVYDEFRSRSRDSGSHYALADFVKSGVTDEVRSCAGFIAREASGRNLTWLDTVSFVLAFSRDAIPYASDEETHGCTDYCNYPIETLYEQRGDCEDHAILTAALLIQMGIDACLVVVRLPDGSGHAAVAVHSMIRVEGCYLERNGRRYYYCEATPDGDWRFGEIPEEYSQRGAELTVVPLTLPLSNA